MNIERYTDKYFLKTVKTLDNDNYDPKIIMQVFQKQDDVMFCGIERVINLFYFNRILPGNEFEETPETRGLKIHYRPDGYIASAHEPLLHIHGHASDILDMETIMLGILSRCTRVATNVWKLRRETDKPIFFFPARFDLWMNEEFDGYSATVGGANDCSTDAQAEYSNKKGMGTMPHSLIACYGGDMAAAVIAYDKKHPNENVIALVDFNNDCCRDAIIAATTMENLGKKLYGVRLDTSESMIDKCLWDEMGPHKKFGVCKELVFKVRDELDRNGFGYVKIFVSGGFNASKIKLFEKEGVPADGFGVGSNCFDGKTDFTADVVKVNKLYIAKEGRKFIPMKFWYVEDFKNWKFRDRRME